MIVNAMVLPQHLKKFQWMSVKPLMILVGGLSGFFVLLGILTAVLKWMDLTTAIGLIVGGLIILPIFFFLFRYSVNKNSNANPLTNASVSCNFEEDRFVYNILLGGGGAETVLAYGALPKAVLNGGCLYLYVQNVQALLLPMGDLADVDKSALVQFLKAKLGVKLTIKN